MTIAQETTSLLDFARRRRVPVIRQTEAAECGLACLAMIASYHGFDTDLGAMRRRFSLSMKGISLQTLIAMGDQIGLNARPLKADLEALDQIALPAVLHWDLNHFVVLRKLTQKGAVILDPAFGEKFLNWEEMSKHYTGVAVEFAPASDFKPRHERSKLRLSQLWTAMSGFKRTLGQLVLLSLILQVFVLASPFYVQIVVDQVLTKFDVDLLVVLALGFALFAVVYAVTNALRAQLVLYAGEMLSFQMMVNIFRHLLRLPHDYFEKRHIGDIVSRFASTTPIKTLLTEGFAAGLIDGVMAITTFTLMVIYSPALAFLALGGLLIVLAFRLALYRRFRQRSEEAILARALEDSNFIETVRGVLSIKLFKGELVRQQLWQNRLADTVNADVTVGKFKIAFEFANKLVFGIATVLIVYFAARMVIAGGFSVGMLFAFLAYMTLFAEKTTALVELLIELKLLDLHLERISDIALAKTEWDVEDPTEALPLEGRIELRDVSFRYADFEQGVIKDLSCVIEPGEAVAITGPSGAGKTTLMKIMLGLLTPQEGEVLIDGAPLAKIGLRAYRGQVGAVMQDDRLFAGSIAENIAVFDTELDMERVEECARIAAIHRDIVRMPMGYETLVGDMGTVLSGGQKQRVLLARALYRNPRMLFLDEGTAHLDAATEEEVNRAIGEMNITRVILAHRTETINAADRILLLADGKLQPIEKSELSVPRGGGLSVA